jgi:hypothetical protein
MDACQKTRNFKMGSKIAMSWCQWLTPIILVTQEREIRRIKVHG